MRKANGYFRNRIIRFDRADQGLGGRLGNGGLITQVDFESMEGPFNRNHADLLGGVGQIAVIRKIADQVLGPDREQLGFDIINRF
ncbi:hypothetical protein [Trichococcus collinsii]|uniref:Uncharacterized protein n=1 Tax=Trichococcus collinsii TaxID=157076 RepID=A0AB37ZWM4_9LACT|nr:hypothetical protein [Trichococcus collinsii]CZQ82645.1 Hypothetical protein Tcol_230 [Trichococcus collinsii]SDZ86815.1 hypothetical protein SAMN04488525_101449 [Trichococcus collinsii]